MLTEDEKQFMWRCVQEASLVNKGNKSAKVCWAKGKLLQLNQQGGLDSTFTTSSLWATLLRFERDCKKMYAECARAKHMEKLSCPSVGKQLACHKQIEAT